MQINITLNGKMITDDAASDETLYSFLRRHECYSVKCGCETTNCGLCTVLLDGEPILSCAKYVAAVNGREVTTLEGVQEEAAAIGGCMADEGSDQCGFCNPGFLMNAISLFRKNPTPDRQTIEEYMAGNLCRCTGYEGQTRALLRYAQKRKESV